jgi:PAS domain S-box-containing protein
VGALLDLTELKQAQEALRQAHSELEVRVQERTEVLRIAVNQLQEEVNERRRAQTELTKQTELVQDLYNRAPCGYHSLDREGWIVRINDTELEWLGYKRGELVKRVHFEDLLAAESRPAFRENFRELLGTGAVRDREYAMKRKDGTTFPVLLSATVVLDDDGNFLLSRSTIYDITERKQSERHLQESEERLRLLASQLLTAQEQERKRLAGALHDELGHALLTLKLSLGAIVRQLLPEQEAVHRLLQEQTEYIVHVIEEVRRLYHDLSPGDLEDLGLSRALHNLIEDFGSHQLDITFAVDLADLTGKLSLPAQTIMYRLVQEALTNIGKHAEPTRVNIWAAEENQHVRLNIEDDGRGFDVSEVERDPHRGVGLAAMRERLYIVGGSMEIWSEPGVGTKLTFTVPVAG